MNRFVSWLCKIVIDPLTQGFFVKEIKGKENITNFKRNFILVSNHQSYLDVLVDGCLCLPRRFHFIGQIDGWRGVSKFLILGIYSICGVIPLDRKTQESRKKAMDKAIESLKKGDILVIYPEGTRSVDGKIQEGKFGVAKIFLKTSVPILPTGIKGSFELFPPKGKMKIKKIIKVNIGKPLFFERELKEAENLKENSKKYYALLQKITDKIMEEINNLTVIL
jgi:1-acyl-sn-glycerol-3-phosphate acyltransferase